MQDVRIFKPERFGDRLDVLRDEHQRPERFYIRGNVDALDAPCVAIAGARACSTYGATVARTFARDLAAAGITIVSGLARGIDAEAHRGALDAENGRTVAVLGCGIDRNYPASHGELADRIAESGGAILSEYGPSVEPAPWRFPARNRIIAALSAVVVVVEARERSGALITADMAMEYGRVVMAVPGEVTSALSAGSNGLFRHGARAALEVADVLELVAEGAAV
jgi:DNA processing protein